MLNLQVKTAEYHYKPRGPLVPKPRDLIPLTDQDKNWSSSHSLAAHNTPTPKLV